MIPIKKKVSEDGSVLIEDALKMAKIEPGDWVKIISTDNKVIIKLTTPKKPKGVIRSVAGILKNEHELVDEMLKIRETEDDRYGNNL